jgi:HSP20 family molecular chaperone IbpA
MANTQMTKKTAADVARTESPRSEATYVPDVDILDTEEAVRLVADMPGVDPGSVDVTVENGVLTIEGRAQLPPPEGYENVGQEFALGRYRRDFNLTDAVDTEGIKARVVHGVLEVTLPKSEQVKTRKIKIEQ